MASRALLLVGEWVVGWLVGVVRAHIFKHIQHSTINILNEIVREMEQKLKSPHHIMITNVHCGYFHGKIYIIRFPKVFSWGFCFEAYGYIKDQHKNGLSVKSIAAYNIH